MLQYDPNANEDSNGGYLPLTQGQSDTVYLSSDCSGSPIAFYSQTVASIPTVYKGIGSAAGKFFVYQEKFINRDEKVVNSYSLVNVIRYINNVRTETTECRKTDYVGYTIPAAFELTKITLPFNLPVALPLKF